MFDFKLAVPSCSFLATFYCGKKCVEVFFSLQIQPLAVGTGMRGGCIRTLAILFCSLKSHTSIHFK